MSLFDSKGLEILTPDELSKAEKLVTHSTPIGDVAFMVPAGGQPLTKSYVEAHYRHTSDGKLIFVHAYHNKIYAQPEDLTAEKIAQQPIDNTTFKGKPLKNPANEKLISYHYGDEVFVKYSHMHDQHFLVGAVVGIRDDKSKDGMLVGVRLINGKVEYYAPDSLVHLYKQDNDKRGHEKSHHKDNKGNEIAYQHLSVEQRQKFYDLYKLWFRLQRLGENLALQQNKHMFMDEHGNLPSTKGALTAEQKIILEQKNPHPVVPYDALVQAVAQEGYDDGKHHAMVKKLLADIKTIEEKGIPAIEFPKLYKPKSKKQNPYVSPAWVGGLFPSVETEDKENVEDSKKLQWEIKQATGLKGTPSTAGVTFGNSSDFHYGKPIVHGAVAQPKPEGSHYEPAPKVPSFEEQKKADLKASFEAAEAAQPTKETEPEKSKSEPEKPKAAPVPTVEATKEPEPKLVIHGDEAEDIADLHFSVTANAAKKGFAGAHTKYIVQDDKGNEYLFKPYSDGLHRVWADIISAKLAKAIGIPTVEMGSKPVKIMVPPSFGGTYAGKHAVGSVQKIVPDLKHNTIEHWVKNKFKGCPQHVVEQLQKEHVMDWLLGNNDAHASQFIVDKNGQLVGVDKGQAFKFYAQDALSLDYDPNYNKGVNHEQVYNLLLLAGKAGHVKLNWGVVHDFIENNMANLSSLGWAQLVKPYAENSVEWADKWNKFVNLATSRKASLAKDFKKLYDSAGIATEYSNEKKTYVKAAPLPKPVLPESDTYEPKALHQIDTAFHGKVLKAGAHGLSRMIGGGDIEDMNVLFTPYGWKETKEGKTGKGLEVSFKLMAGAENKVLPWFEKKVADQTIEYQNMHGALPSNSDPLGAIVIAAAKTVNHHAPTGGSSGDGEYNELKMNQFAKYFQGLDEFDPEQPVLAKEEIAAKLLEGHITAAKYDDYVTLAHMVGAHYHTIAQDVMEAVKNKTKTSSKMYSAWQGQYKTKKISVSDKKHPWATYPHFTINEDGELVRDLGEKQATFLGSNHGVMFSKDLPGNIQVRYYPHHSSDLGSQNNYRSQQGQMIVDFHNWDGDINAMHEARQVMKQMGIDHRLATHADVEALYLTRLIWQQKGNLSEKGSSFKPNAEYQKIQQMPNDEKKIDALKKMCAEVYGAWDKKYQDIDPEKLPTYDPTPKWDADSGHHYFLNPYVMHHLHYEKPKQVRIPHHQLTVGTSNEMLTNLAKHGLMSVEARHKFNWPYQGMSPQADQISGGAAYVGLKASTKPYDDHFKGMDTGHLVFRPELLARTDAFAYANDHFGDTHDDPQQASHGKGLHDRMTVMDMLTGGGHQSLYEIRFKWRVPLDKWFEGIHAPSDDYGYAGKTTKGWVSKFKMLLKKYKPHILNHSQFVGIKD
jgi:hypothetical protein